jgi:MFS family permease
MGLLGTAATAPNLLVGLAAGVWADRVRRRPILIGADITRSVLLLSIPIAWAVDLLTIWQLYTVLFVAGACTTFFDVAYVSYLPSLVARSQLVSANGKLEASRSIATSAGPALAGGLVQIMSAPVVVGIDALSYLFSAALVRMIRAPEPQASPDGHSGGVRRAMRDGLVTLWHDPLLRPIAMASMLYRFFGNAVGALLVLYATRGLGITPAELGLIFGIGGAGSFLGAVLATPTASRLGLGPVLVAAALLGALSRLVIPLVGDVTGAGVVVLASAQFVYWLVGTIFIINTTSLVQATTPHGVLGRVTGSYRFLTQGSIPLGALLGGVLGELLGLELTLVVAAVGMGVAVLWLAHSPVRTVRTIDAPAA